MSQATLFPVQTILKWIVVIRGQKALLDADLAKLYGVSTAQLKRAVSRNRDRFPDDFMFQLNRDELAALRCQSGTSKRGRGGTRYRPYAFTEQGVAMLSSVLRSKRAVQVNIAIMRAFVRLRAALDANRELAKKFAELEMRVDKHDEDIAAIIEAIRQLLDPPAKPKRGIGFHVRESSARYGTSKTR